MDADDSESQGSRTVTGSHPVMPIPSPYIRQYYVAHAMDMDDHYSTQQEGTNIYNITPEHLALLHMKQQEQQMQNPAHYIYYTPQQQHFLHQQELLKYRQAIQNPALNGHHKQKDFEECPKAQMQKEKQTPIKPKIKVEPDDEPKEDEMLIDHGEGSQEKSSLSSEEPNTSHQRSCTTSTHSQQEFTHVDVKKRLQDFVLNKKQREQAVASLTNDSAFKHWSQNLEKTDDLAPLGSHLDPSHFPLRKTASEPNLKVKSRLKAKVAEHRAIGSPLLHRPRDRTGNKLHRSQTIETAGNENLDRSNPGSPTQSMSASPGREGSSPLGAPGSSFGHSLPNLQAIPRLSASIDRSHINQLIRNRYMIHHPRSDLEFQNQQYNDYENMEEESGNTLNTAALKRAQLSNIALVKAQMKILSLPTGALNSNALLSGSPHNVYSGPASPPSQNNLLSIPKTSLPASSSHRQLRQTLSAPGYSLSKSQQHQQILKQNHELLQQHQHLQFLQQQQRQSPAYNLQFLQQDVLLQQLGKQGFSKQQKEQAGTLKDELEKMQKEQEQATLRERAYQQHKKEQQLVQVRASEDVPLHGTMNDQQLQELLIQQLQRQDAPRRNLLNQQLLQHQQLIQLRQAELQEAPLAAVSSPSASVGHRPLTRTVSLPAVGSGKEGSPSTNRTGIAYDTLMLKHQCSCGETSSHPEHPGRLQSILARLQETGVTNICERVRPRKASLPEILTVHSEQHTMLYGGSTQCRTKAEDGTITTLKCFNTLPCGGMGVDGDTIWNEIHSANAARMAVGCVIELANKVAAGELKNGMAIVRPPGHHAEAHQAMGFCYFNNVAIAARILRLKMSVERVLIVDWDIHHGNGTQQMFYDDPHVLYISLHRHDEETFFPGTGKSEECGAGIGVGYNVNIAWNGGLDPPYGDPEYFAAFRSVVLPIAKEFQPDIVLVSAGFDAAGGHSPQLGGYNVSAACFAQLTKQLMELADGQIVMALEGGYSLPSLCDCAEACIRGLLSQTLPEVSTESLRRPPNHNAVTVLEKTIAIQSRYWNSVKRSVSLINQSMVDAQQREKEELDTVSALASLSMGVVKEKPVDVQMEIQDES